jgi:hypothetical protein
MQLNKMQRIGGIGDFLVAELDHLRQMSQKSITKQTKSRIRFSRLYTNQRLQQSFIKRKKRVDNQIITTIKQVV